MHVGTVLMQGSTVRTAVDNLESLVSPKSMTSTTAVLLTNRGEKLRKCEGIFKVLPTGIHQCGGQPLRDLCESGHRASHVFTTNSQRNNQKR